LNTLRFMVRFHITVVLNALIWLRICESDAIARLLPESGVVGTSGNC